MTELSNFSIETVLSIIVSILLLVIFMLSIYTFRLKSTALSTARYIYSLEDSIKTSGAAGSEKINIDSYIDFGSSDYKRIVEFRLEASYIDQLNEICLSKNYPRAVILRAIVSHYLLNRQK